MAITAAQYQSMRLAFRIMLSVEGVGPTDADVLAFSKQLFTDASGATPLSTGRNFLATEVLRTVLSAATAPTDSDVGDFFTQLATDVSGVTPIGATAKYRQMRNALRAAMSGGGLNPTDADVLGFFAAYSFNGDFGALLDSLVGAGTTVGYYRGDLGLHTTGAVVNSWDNQRGTWGNCTEVSAGVGIGNTSSGVGGRAGILANGTTQSGKIATVPQPLVLPATTNLHAFSVMRSTNASPGANAMFFGVSFNFAMIQLPASLTIEGFNGAATATALLANAWARLRMSFTGTASDAIKWGSSAPVVAAAGNNAGGAGPLGVFGDGVGGTLFTGEVALLMFNIGTLANFLAAQPAMEAAIASFYGATPQV